MIVVPALLAAGAALYLAVVAYSSAGRPVGCGAGSGCDEVLSSRWSKVVGVPVGLPAAGLYLGLAAAVIGSARTKHPAVRQRLSALQWVAAGAILAAVHWFVGLQWFELQAFCPWCLVDHGLGVVTALAVLGTEVSAGRFRPGSFLLGVALTGLLACLQIFVPEPGPQAATLSGGQIELLEGGLQLHLDEVPQLGPAPPARPVVVLFDYCCPHCRQTHAHLLAARERAPDAFTLVLLPTPLNAECNSHLGETEPRFEAACDLARLALAVWRADRAHFAEFDRWLFASEQPRSASAARDEAARLIGAAALDAALKDPWIAERIRADVDAFAASGIDAIPVLLAPGRGGVSGRVADAAALERLLHDAFGLSLPQGAAAESR